MPLYNSEENFTLSAIEQAYKDMQEGNLDKFKKAQRERADNRMNPDEEQVKIKPEPPKPEYNAEMGPVKKLKARNKRKGEGLGVKPMANRAQKNAGRGDQAQPEGGGRPMRG